jgi:hypothetical protein
MVKIVAVSPLLLGERPRLAQVRFQGEGGGAQLAATLRAALDWTGDARMAPTTRPAAGNE